jgi:hypothetical protein
VRESLRQVLWAFGFAGLGILRSKKSDLPSARRSPRSRPSPRLRDNATLDLRPFRPASGMRVFPAATGSRRPSPGGMSAGSLEAGGRLRLDRQQKRPICRNFTGATGLEPATSGVTGRSWHLRAARDWAGITGESRALRPWRCGDSRASAGASGDLLRDVCGMRSLSWSPNPTGDWSQPTPIQQASAFGALWRFSRPD